MKKSQLEKLKRTAKLLDNAHQGLGGDVADFAKLLFALGKASTAQASVELSLEYHDEVAAYRKQLAEQVDAAEKETPQEG